MKRSKLAIWLTTMLTGMGGVQQTLAQSTGSQTQEDVIVITAAARPRSVEGAILQQSAPKSRTAINQEYIDTQSSGQSIAQTLNVVTPGYNFTNNDPYGSSGGNLRLRGFDGNRISLTFDGIPLNDTGNYAIYTNQQMDGELIETANVNLGSTDVDSPTASAAGGTINYITHKPTVDFGATTSFAAGENNYGRAFAMVDTGEWWSGGLRSFVAASTQSYEKWKGFGALEKKQANARFYLPLGDRSFANLALHYNRNRNNNFRQVTLNDIALNGYQFDYEATCPRPTPGPGAQVENTSGATFNCTNYYGRQVNPSDTGNVRGSGSFALTDTLTLTLDPSFQYVLADGGGQFGRLSETDGRLRGAGVGPGVDLNGDGDLLDTVAMFTPSVTNTRRYGVTSSLIWNANEDHRFRIAGTYDYGRHRQTGEFTFLDGQGNPLNVFGGKHGHGPRVVGNDTAHMRNRDRFSIASLEQLALEWRGEFMDDNLIVSVGVRAPTFERELNQFCYSQDGTSNVYCTTQPATPVVVGDPNEGNFTFPGQSGSYIAPYQLTKTYDATLPNVGAVYKVAGGHSVYASYAEGFSAPRTDNLYTVTRPDFSTQFFAPGVAPETTKAYDLGYRYAGAKAQGSIALWKIDYENRIVSAFDPGLGVNVDRNVGNVETWGVDAQLGVRPTERLALIAAASFNNSELKSNAPLAPPNSLPTAGKKLVETPDWTLGWRAAWDASEAIHFAIQGKFVDDRFSTDVNDQKAPGYTVWDADLRIDLPRIAFADSSVLQLNINNLLDEGYLGSISSRSNSIALPGSSASQPLYSVGAPRTVQVSLKSKF